MSEPIKTTERFAKSGYEYVEMTWSYEEMLEMFNGNCDDNLVVPLVLRCQEYEAELTRLRAESQRLREALSKCSDCLEAGCARYCRWYDTGEPQVDAGAMTYMLVTDMRMALADIKEEVSDE